MVRLPPLRRLRVAVPIVLALVAGTALAQQARKTPPATEATAYGLIVQLRDAPAHEALARERAQAAGNAVGRAQDARWQAVLAKLQRDATLARELPLVARAVRRDPVGARAHVLRFERPLAAAEARRVMDRLAADPEVAWVEPNVRERPQQVSVAPNDPYFQLGLAGQWWLRDVQGSNASPIDARLRGVPGFLTAWFNRTVGGAGAVVAVLDTGITCHPDLGNEVGPKCIGGSILPGYDFVTDSDYANDGNGRDDDPRDPGDWVDSNDRARDPARYRDCEIGSSSWHGTAIAGQLAALTNNAVGVSAINWNGRVLPVRVAGKCGAEVADLVDGMRWAAGLPVAGVPDNPHPARIINISFGGSAACGTAYQQAIDELRTQKQAIVIAAAGNGYGDVSRPANCDGVVGVGALNRDGFKSNYSNFGAKVVLSTVGGDDNGTASESGAWAPYLHDTGITTIGNTGGTIPSQPGYYNEFGTSFSAPIVAGAVSLMLSVNPNLTVDQIIQGLRASARPHVTSSLAGFGTCSDANPGRCLCTTSTCGAGILDADQAVAYAAALAAASPYTPPTWPTVVLDTTELRTAVALGPDRPANGTPPPSGSGGGGGGGVASGAWLAGLLLATAALWCTRRLSPRKRQTSRRRAG
jgi:serine protease